MEEGVVVLRGIEGRIEINQVNRLVLEVAAQDVQIIAVIKRAHEARLGNASCFVNAARGVLAESWVAAM